MVRPVTAEARKVGTRRSIGQIPDDLVMLWQSPKMLFVGRSASRWPVARPSEMSGFLTVRIQIERSREWTSN
jgi:hypothetical protein